MKADFQPSPDDGRQYGLQWEWTQIFREISRNLGRLADHVDPPGGQQPATEASIKALTAKIDGLVAERDGRPDELAIPTRGWYSVKEAVEFLGSKYKSRTLADACNQGRIQNVEKVGKAWRIPQSALEQIRNEGRLPPLLE